MHQDVTGGNAVIKKIQEVGRNILIVDHLGGIYLFREGELIDKAGMGISDCDCVGMSVNNRWLGVGSR